MDFARVLEDLSRFLSQREYRFALVGGLGLAVYGLARATLALDLAVEAAAQDALILHMEALGYETLHRSRGYSNHVHTSPELGRVDFVYVRGRTCEELFGDAREEVGPGGVEVLVPRPEHLAAMKVTAMKNDPERTFQELADIRFLIALPGVDRDEVRGYFLKHGLEERYRELEETL